MVEGASFHYLSSLRCTRHGLEMSASLWVMGITDKAKFPWMFISLKHSH